MEFEQFDTNDVIKANTISALEAFGFEVLEQISTEDRDTVVYYRNGICVAIQVYYYISNGQCLDVNGLQLCIANEDYYETHDLDDEICRSDIGEWIASFEEEIQKPNPCLCPIPVVDDKD